MRKILIALIIISVFLFAFACDKQEEKFNLSDNVSYYDTHLYTGESSNFAIKIVRGKKELTPVADGVAGDLVEFATLKVTPLHMDLFNKQYAYKLKGENGEITGELAKDMFGVSFSSELTNIASVGDLQSVTITATGVEETIELTNRLKDMLEWEDVLSISETQFKDKIQLEKDDFKREIHIKYINNRTDRHSPYYWYIAYIASTTDYWAVLLDPETGEVVSKKS
ncbi:MAG: hypothetical protein ACOX3U_01380 [Christensenellales bacterium]|jgi:hypothetical protein